MPPVNASPTFVAPPSPKKRLVRSLMVLICVIAAALVAYGAYAATRNTKSDIVVHVVDPTTPKPYAGINGATVTVKPATKGTTGCSPATHQTATQTDPSNKKKNVAGLAIFNDCPNAGSTKAYILDSVSKAGYIPRATEPRPLKTGKFKVTASKNKKNRIASVTFYLVKDTRRGTGGAGGVNDGGIPPTLNPGFVPFQCAAGAATSMLNKNDAVAVSNCDLLFGS